MSSEQPFDDFLKRKLEDQDFEFREEYWDKALYLLEEHDKKKKRRALFFWLSLAACLLTVGGAALYLSQEKEIPSTLENAQVGANTTIDDQSGLSSKIKKTEDPQKMSTSVEGSEKSDSQQEAISKVVRRGSSQSNNENRVEQSSTNSEKATDNQNLANETGSSIFKKRFLNRKQLANSTKRNRKAQKDKSWKDRLVTDRGVYPSSKDAAGQGDSSSTKGSQENKQVVINNQGENKVNTDKVEQTHVVDSSKSLAKNTVDTVDKANNNPKNRDIILVKEGPSSRFDLVLHSGLQNVIGNSENTVAPIGGVGIRWVYSWNNHWAIQAQYDFQYSKAMQHQSDFDSIHYDFGFVRDHYHLVMQSMYASQINLSVRYRINPQHSFYAGGGLYVIHGGQVETNKTRITDFETGITQTETKTQSLPGTNPVVQMHLGYLYETRSRLNFGVDFIYGFNPALGYSGVKAQNLQYRVLIGYRLW